VPGNLPGLVLGITLGVLLSWIYFLQWRYRYSKTIRRDAVQRSLAVTSGKVHEQLIPYLPGFPYNPKDVRFIGSPVDLVVFDGLAEGCLQRIVFVEVKTGSAGLTQRERSIRETVEEGAVDWAELRVTQPLSSGVE
jgi:predicted Holliday junction resolvase-like endonuclease